MTKPTKPTKPTNRVRHRTRRRAASTPPVKPSKPKIQQKEDKPSPTDQPNNYEIGYGKPPKDTQFKKGQSGNKGGRGKGHKNFATDLREELAEHITMNEGGKKHRITKQRAVIKATVNSAARGNQAAVGRLTKMILDNLPRETGDAEPAELPEEDAELLAEYLRVKVQELVQSGKGKEDAE